MAAVLVALNAVFQVLAYAGLGFFYLQVLPGWLGLDATSLHVSMVGTVAVFLGIPLVAGYLTRTLGERARGRDRYEQLFPPRIALPPLANFAIMWFGGFAIGRRLHLTYANTAALAFSAASNDFEPAIAVAIGVSVPPAARPSPGSSAR